MKEIAKANFEILREAALSNATIEFLKDTEAYPQVGTRARLVTVYDYDDSFPNDEVCFCLIVDYSGFREYNASFEERKYRDSSGEYCLNIHEAGMYEQTESIYVDGDCLGTSIKLLDKEAEERSTMLRIQHYNSNSGLSYVNWLEDKIDKG